MEYCDNKLCISVRELEADGILTGDYCRQLARRNKLKIARRGGGKGNCAMVVVESLPTPYLDQVKEKHPYGNAVLLRCWILSNYELDQAAVTYFMDWASRQHSDKASDELAQKYAVNASVLNTCIRLYNRSRDYRRLMGEKYNWDMMATTIETLREEFGHDLPASTLRFRKKVNEYKQCGYECLISGKFGNQNKRKTTYKDERLVMSLRVLPNQPYGSDVHEMYIQFVCGELEVWDFETGEIFDPDDFVDKNGNPKELSKSTIRNILNKPSNKLLVEHSLRSYTTFMHEQMPHMHRHGGEWALSQITMDDVDLPRRMKGNEYVHAYYAYDVVSQCRIGMAYGRGKDDALVVECFRDMFRLIARHGWGIPAGIEVEQHLMIKYKNGFLKADEVFNEYKDTPGAVFLVDPPYLSTEVGTYTMYWKLSDYLDVLTVLTGHSFIYFTSNKSSILELCEWIGKNQSLGNPFKGCMKSEFNAHINYNATYTDIMLYKRCRAHDSGGII